MYKTIDVDDMTGVILLLEEQRYRPELKRYRSLHIYRGMPNADFRLRTSLKRNCKDKSSLLEPMILANFTKYAALEDPAIEESVWKQMILGQHHGLPTRLYDWSFSALTGLHFATSESNLDDIDKHDAVVWRIDVDELHALLPEKYQKVMKEAGTTVFSLKMLESVCRDPVVYDADMNGEAMVIVEPPSIDQRIINQYSFFSVIPSNMQSVEGFLRERTQKTVKYVIRKEIKWQIRDLLDQLNVSERIVYPGLDGLSKWLARHYYVREEII
ncbi:MAG: FRG domain-containing protein [Lachnospiraceae bacterium]|nr:FRG domain-containing protein [Lachnospiraceae bacterium]